MSVEKRRVVFYGVEDVDGRPEFDPVAALSPLGDLSDEDWTVHEHNTTMAVIVDHVGTKTSPSHLRFLRLRDDRPYQMGRDRQPRLIDLEEDSRVTEFTFVVIWPDGFAAALSSRDAPSIKYLSTYFARTSGQQCVIADLFSTDVVQRLRRLLKTGGGLTKASVKVQTAVAQQIENDEQLRGFSSFWKSTRGFEAVTAEVTLSVDRKRDRFLDPGVGAEIEHLVSYGDLIDTMVVKGKDPAGHRDEINLKTERRSLHIAYDERSSVGEIYREIEQARRDLKGGPLDHSARIG